MIDKFIGLSATNKPASSMFQQASFIFQENEKKPPGETAILRIYSRVML